jgi:CSLREA domain-containing protein
MMHSTQSRAKVGRILALGLLLAALVVAPLALAAKPAHAATTFTVNSTSDRSNLDFAGGVFDGSLDGKCFTGSMLVVQGEECTLRAAIQEANKTPGAAYKSALAFMQMTCKIPFLRSGRCWFRTSDLCRVKAEHARSPRFAVIRFRHS